MEVCCKFLHVQVKLLYDELNHLSNWILQAETNSRFGQWEYFKIKREDFFVGQTVDANSNAGALSGTSEWDGRGARSLYKRSERHNDTHNYKLTYLCTKVLRTL